MIKTSLPPWKYSKGGLTPNLEDRANGMVKPLLWGRKANIIPVCVDESNVSQTYQIAERRISAINSINADGVDLVLGTDYTENLGFAQFTLYTTPFLLATGNYYMILEGDYPINGTDYCYWVGSTASEYAFGHGYEINGGGAWSLFVPDADLGFQIFGKTVPQGPEDLMVWFNYTNPKAYNLRDAAARTRLAQSFKVGATGFYVSKIVLPVGKTGNPVGNIRLELIRDSPPAAKWIKSYQINCASFQAGASIPWPFRSSPSKILVDATGFPNFLESGDPPITNVADILYDCYVNELYGSTNALNPADLAYLKAARPEELNPFIDREIKWEDFTKKLEAGQFFKILPSLAGDLAIRIFEAGEPSGTPHFFDEDLISFSMLRAWNECFEKFQIKYDENPENQEFKIQEVESDVARYAYHKTDTLTVETYLKEDADALSAAWTYGRFQHVPPKYAIFEIGGGAAFNLIPSEKVLLTRSRADYPGGSLNAVLFRIMEITKNLNSGVAKIKAILDSEYLGES